MNGDDGDDDVFAFRGFFDFPFGNFNLFGDMNQILKEMDRFFEDSISAPNGFGGIDLQEPTHDLSRKSTSRNPLRDSMLREPDSNIRKHVSEVQSSASAANSLNDSISSPSSAAQQNSKSSWSDWLFGSSKPKRGETAPRDSEVQLDTVLKERVEDLNPEREPSGAFAQRTITRIERRADGSIVKRRTVTYSNGVEQTFVEEIGGSK